MQFPDKVAIEECESGSTRYGELVRLADRVRDRLRKLEVEPGDRVGICMRKSADAVALLFGIMKAGAAMFRRTRRRGLRGTHSSFITVRSRWLSSRHTWQTSYVKNSSG